MNDRLVIIRGGGDIASGTIHRLVRCGYRVVVLETQQPTVIRRTVAYANAIFDGDMTIEGIKATKVDHVSQCQKVWDKGHVPVLVDPKGESTQVLKPLAVVDAILAKKNLGTTMNMAPIVIGLGPGFEAGRDVHAVVETNRGHYLGRVIHEGPAMTNTGIPGNIDGYSWERVIRAPKAGIVYTEAHIGDMAEQEQCIGHIGDTPILAPLKGVIRGLIHEGIRVTEGFKIGDVDPRGTLDHCFSISDKARAIAGGVLEAILYFEKGDGRMNKRTEG